MEVAGIAIDMMTVVTAVIETEATIVGMTTELEQTMTAQMASAQLV